VGTIDFSDPANVQHLEWQEQWIEANLQNYVKQRRDSITPNGVNDQTIANLQSLRLETAYLTLQATEHPGKLNNYLFQYNALQTLGATATQATDLSLFDIVTPQGTVYQEWARFDDGANIIPGDFNGEDNDSVNNFNIYFSRGDGYFDLVTPQGDVYQWWTRFDDGANIIPGDFNGDGKTDFIRQEKNGWDNDNINNFNIYFSRGDGYFDLVTPPGDVYQLWSKFDDGANIIPGDFNGDGKTDFIRQEKGGWDDDNINNFNVYFSRGDGFFDIVTPQGDIYQWWTKFDDGANIIPGDFNGDGKTDFIRQEKNGWDNDSVNNFNIYFSRGDGYFDLVTPQGTVYQEWARFDDGANIIPGDFNGDGYDDFIRQEKNFWDNDSVNNFNIYFSNTTKLQALKSIGYSDYWKDISLDTLRNQYYPELNNPTTLATLQQQISDQQTQSQQQIEQLKNSISQKQAQAAASISQADWYQEKSAFYWERSRKQGPTWIEWRSYQEKKWYGRKQTKQQAITHVDHDWIIWDTYTKQATALREHAAQLLKGVETDTLNNGT